MKGNKGIINPCSLPDQSSVEIVIKPIHMDTKIDFTSSKEFC